MERTLKHRIRGVLLEVGSYIGGTLDIQRTVCSHQIWECNVRGGCLNLTLSVLFDFPCYIVCHHAYNSMNIRWTVQHGG